MVGLFLKVSKNYFTSTITVLLFLDQTDSPVPKNSGFSLPKLTTLILLPLIFLEAKYFLTASALF